VASLALDHSPVAGLQQGIDRAAAEDEQVASRTRADVKREIRSVKRDLLSFSAPHHSKPPFSDPGDSASAGGGPRPAGERPSR
jgi:hypothetical protein